MALSAPYTSERNSNTTKIETTKIGRDDEPISESERNSNTTKIETSLQSLNTLSECESERNSNTTKIETLGAVSMAVLP